MLGPRSRQHERAFPDEIEEGVNWLCILTKMPASFAKDDLGGVEGTAARSQLRHAPPMPLIAGVEPAD